VVPHFTRQILAGGSVMLHGSPPGSQTRDFVYVDDVVDALVRSGLTPGLSGATLNVGSGRETSLAELVAELERSSGRSAQVIAVPEQSGGIVRMCADISAARRVLGWVPRVDLASGLARMTAAARAARDANR
jgi:nucleoside-diphosphate-sugar epimerase